MSNMLRQPDIYRNTFTDTPPVTIRPGGPVFSVFGRIGDVVAVSGDYNASQVTNAVDSSVVYANPVWISSLAWTKITGAPNIVTDPTTTKGDLIVRSTTALSRLGVGTDGKVLTADSAQPLGMSFQTPAVPSISAAQTPWLQNVNGGGFSLSNCAISALSVSAPGYTANGPSTASPPFLNMFVNSLLRWVITTFNSESTGNAGSDFTINRYNDAGSFLGRPMTITRSDGTVIFGNPVKVGNNIVGGAPFANLTVATNIGVYMPSTSSAGTPVSASLYLGDINFNTSGLYQAAPGLSAVYDVIGLSASLAFYTYFNGTTRTERMRILSNGNIGIGITNPSYKLDVSGDCNLSSGSIYRINGVDIRGWAQTPWVADENASGFTLRSVGFIGIGIASPGAMLDVYNTTASTPLVRFGRGVSDQSFLVQFVNGVAGGASGTEQGRVGLYYGASWNCGLRFLRGSGASDGPLALDAAGSERMRIDSTQATLSNSLKVNDSSLTGSAFAPLTVIGSIGVYSATTATAGAPIGASLYLSDNGFYYSGGYNLAPGLSAVYEVASGVSSALAFYTYASAGGR